MSDQHLDNKRHPATMELIIRIVATTALWSMASLIGLRLKHPMVGVTLGAVAAVLTLVIWTHKSKGKEN